MPVNFIKNGYKGYLEDRRPNSEADPYQIVSQILETISGVRGTGARGGIATNQLPGEWNPSPGSLQFSQQSRHGVKRESAFHLPCLLWFRLRRFGHGC